jgi:hypothetical protein
MFGSAESRKHDKYVMKFSRRIFSFNKVLVEKLIVAKLMKNFTESVIEHENLNFVKETYNNLDFS